MALKHMNNPNVIQMQLGIQHRYIKEARKCVCV
jgi:hypothetical protein